MRLVDSSIGVGCLKSEALLCNLSTSRLCCGPHQRRIRYEGSHTLEYGTLDNWCTSPLVVPLSWIDHSEMITDRTIPYMPWQSLSLVGNTQIDYTEFVDSQAKGIYLEVVASCAFISLRVVCLDVSLWFVVDPTLRLLLPWACMPQTLHASPRGCKPCQKTSPLHRPVQKGFDIKISIKGRNLDLYLILIRTWVVSSPIMIRKKKSSSLSGLGLTNRLWPRL